MSEDIKNTVWSGTFKMCGITLRCYVLEDGMRIINAEDMEMLFECMGSNNTVIDPAEVEAFAKWQKG